MQVNSPDRIHTWLIRKLLQAGALPVREQVAAELGLTVFEIESAYTALASIHGLVLHPHVTEPWVIQPFSLTPTLTWVQGERFGWWAPCMWCALGIASLAGGQVRIDTRLGAEAGGVSIHVRDGAIISPHPLLVHFAIPPKNAWDNVHMHCALLLPFLSVPEVTSWCERHNLPFGEIVPLQQAAALANAWYGTYADEHWHKWSKAEAQAIFLKVGLTSTFWDLGSDVGGF